jgi:hypothetical protein
VENKYFTSEYQMPERSKQKDNYQDFYELYVAYYPKFENLQPIGRKKPRPCSLGEDPKQF